ncbi:hypothetical protein EDC04DRAFT_2600203 [Pisolithus marmoratus]|nr:hypothetical protein EDC04DRAFT_2600203 [Pisolithus marmoratus]
MHATLRDNNGQSSLQMVTPANQMAKGNTRKGMTMIGPTPGHCVKQLKVRMHKGNGQKKTQLVEVAIDESNVASPMHSSHMSSLSKCSTSPSKQHFWLEDELEDANDMNQSPVESLRLPHKTQNDYILEAPPTPRNCTKCEKDGMIQQWTRDFFMESALYMTGLQLQLGHGGAPCPSVTMAEQAVELEGLPQKAAKDNGCVPLPMNEEEWEDVDDIPLHLWLPMGLKYLTVIDVTGCILSYFKNPSMVFTVLDDFLRDNLECGTSGMNYYSKLHRVTSSMFLHLVPNRYHKLLHVARQWHMLKLLKWNGFKKNMDLPSKGDLALFCAACPQPGINVNPKVDLDDWKYSRTVVMDGNFKAEHMQEQQLDDQVWLMDG